MFENNDQWLKWGPFDFHEGLKIIFGNHDVETPMKGLKG
jgi:hypothetical protein